MRRTLSIRDTDAGALLRLAGEAAEHRDLVGRRRHVMHGMRRLIGGHSGLLFQSHRFVPGDGGFGTGDSVIFEGLDPAAERRHREYIVDGQHLDPNAPTMIAMPERVITRHRDRLLGDDAWYRSDHYQNVRRPSGIDDQLYSKVHLPDGTMIGLGLQREPGDPAFTPADCRLVDFFHEQMAFLYLPRPTDVSPTPPTHTPVITTSTNVTTGLPPRLVPVLNALVAGDSAKQVALKLGLSVHTVNEYIKALHRRLGVSSRGELLAKCLGRRPAEGSPPRPAFRVSQF